MAFTHADFFAGTGGFSTAFAQVGKHAFKTVFANDMAEKCKITYDANHDVPMTIGSIHDIDPKDIPAMDVLTMGLPCQPFSAMGSRQGFADKRADVFWKMCDVIAYHQPPCIIIENVKNLTTHDEGNSLKRIIDALSNLGYFITYDVLNTAYVTGLPQNRERIYLVGFKDKSMTDAFKFPKQDIEPSPWRSCLDTVVPEKYYYTKKSKIYGKLQKGMTEASSVYVYKAPNLRSVLSGKLFPTLRASMGLGGNNVPLITAEDGRIRKITPRECFRLQGFPEDFVLPSDVCDTHLYVQAGNAITVRVAHLIGEEIARVLQDCKNAR